MNEAIPPLPHLSCRAEGQLQFYFTLPNFNQTYVNTVGYSVMLKSERILHFISFLSYLH
jgi:hypothetical protein